MKENRIGRAYLLVKLLRTAAFLGISQNAHLLTFIAKFSSSQMQQKEQWISVLVDLEIYLLHKLHWVFKHLHFC